MTFNELLELIDRKGLPRFSKALYDYCLLNYPRESFERGAQMVTDSIVNWEPEPFYPEDWILSQDFTYIQNFAAVLREREVLPPPVPKPYVDLEIA